MPSCLEASTPPRTARSLRSRFVALAWLDSFGWAVDSENFLGSDDWGLFAGSQLQGAASFSDEASAAAFARRFPNPSCVLRVDAFDADEDPASLPGFDADQFLAPLGLSGAAGPAGPIVERIISALPLGRASAAAARFLEMELDACSRSSGAARPSGPAASL